MYVNNTLCCCILRCRNNETDRDCMEDNGRQPGCISPECLFFSGSPTFIGYRYDISMH